MYDKYYGGVSTKNNPAYRNFFMLDALSNSYNAYRKMILISVIHLIKRMVWKALSEYINKSIIMMV